MAQEPGASSVGLDSTLPTVLGHGHRLERRTDSSLGTVPAAPVATENWHTIQTRSWTAHAPRAWLQLRDRKCPCGAGGCCRGTGTRSGQGCREGLCAPLAPARLAARGAQEQPAGGALFWHKTRSSKHQRLKVTAQVTILKVMTSKYQSKTRQQSLARAAGPPEFRADGSLGQTMGSNLPGAPGDQRPLHTEKW